MQLTQKNQQQHRNHSGYESTPKEREQLHIKARERATSNAKQARQELNTLFLRQSEIETSVQSQWEKKIADYEERAVRDEQDEIAALEKKHEDEMREFGERARVEQDEEDEKMRTEVAAVGGKRKAVESREVRESSGNKRMKVGSNPIHDQRNQGILEDPGKEDSLGSAEKERELEKVVDEMSCLNKTKSQMIWLLKQVITAETKLKLKR